MSDLTLIKAIWQVRYPASAKFSDIRGKIAGRWHQPDGDLSEWRINATNVTIKDKRDSMAYQIDVRSLSAVKEFPGNSKQFAEFTTSYTLDTLEMLEIKKITRIGLRYFFAAKRDNFTQLCNRVRNRLFKLNDDEWNLLGGRPVDVGFASIQKFDDWLLHLKTGPMERSQLEGYFEGEGAEKLLPEVSIFADMDLYEENPKIKMNSLDRHLRKHLVEGGELMEKAIDKFVDYYEGFE